VMVAPNWEAAESSETTAKKAKTDWEENAKATADRKHAAYPFKERKKAEEELDANSAQTEVRFKELRKIEFGTHETLKAFSVAAAGAGGDTSNLLNEKLKQTAQRAKAIFNMDIPVERFKVKFDDSSDAANLLRLALVDRFLSACKEVRDPATKACKIEQIVLVDYYTPKVIELPAEEKAKSKNEEEESTSSKKPTKKNKKDKDEDKPEEIDRLVQVPMKALVRLPEQYVDALLYQLGQPTPTRQDSDDRRGYFCVRGFHVAVNDATAPTNSVELCIAVSALLRESEIKALKITLKKDGEKDREKDPF